MMVPVVVKWCHPFCCAFDGATAISRPFCGQVVPLGHEQWLLGHVSSRGSFVHGLGFMSRRRRQELQGGVVVFSYYPSMLLALHNDNDSNSMTK